MRIITAPTVTIVAKQVFVGHPDYLIPPDGDDATKIGSFAAKGCYDSFGENGRANEENQRAILEHRHGSVLEHINYTLFITGVTRALTLEMNRHRQFGVSQRSTRYTAEEDASAVLEPYYANLYNKYMELLTDPKKDDFSEIVDFNLDEINLIAAYLGSLDMSFQAYSDQVMFLTKLNPLGLTGFDLRKWARGKARNLLPHSLETRVTYTGNLRAWRWFIESRSDKHAEPEIRRLADLVLKVLRKEAPLYFEDFEMTEFYDGIPVWTPKYHKV